MSYCKKYLAWNKYSLQLEHVCCTISACTESRRSHNYVTAQKIFNRLCQNQITVTLLDTHWKFHKIYPKTEKYMKKQIYNFFPEHGV